MRTAARRLIFGSVALIVVYLIAVPPGWCGGLSVESVADCRELVRQNPDDLEAYRSYWLLARQHNQWDVAIEGLEGLLVDDPGQPRALLYLGMILSDRGEARTEEILIQAADGFAVEGEPTGEVYSRLGLAFWLDKRHRFDDSRIQRERALEVANDSADPVLAARVRLAQAWQAVGDHDYATARSLFLEVESVAFPDGPIDVRIGVVNGLGYADWATGRYRSAMTHYRRQAAVCAEGGDVFKKLAPYTTLRSWPSVSPRPRPISNALKLQKSRPWMPPCAPETETPRRGCGCCWRNPSTEILSGGEKR
jgi:tetratricopeptide (TPR) repeat protein